MIINCSGQSNQRIQKVVEKDSTGRILKTFDGYVYRIYDSKERLVEIWGNLKRPDFDDNFRTIVEITDTAITTKEYFFETDNKECKILDSLDCYITKRYHLSGVLFKVESWSPEKDNKNKVVKHTLVETEHNPENISIITYLPDYLRKKKN